MAQEKVETCTITMLSRNPSHELLMRGKCPRGEMTRGERPGGKRPVGKCPGGKSPDTILYTILSYTVYHKLSVPMCTYAYACECVRKNIVPLY